MKQWIGVVTTLLVISLASGALKSVDKNSEKALEKAPEKAYPKKVITIKKKPTKSPSVKSPIDSFKDLPDDDLDFIKELDKQFKLHGDKIKIKIERDNSTSKNSKRTVEGDLGYGYYNGQESGVGYEYPKPLFMFYPYSQHDIPPSAPGYHIKEEEQSTISIIPSYSYELKQNGHGGYDSKTAFVPSQPEVGPNDYHQHHDGQGHGHAQVQGDGHNHQYQHNEPVIVLRIPGPTKYATHLQSLLQQYLEIRAAQYLKILEEAEHQKQHQQEQQYHAYNQVQQNVQEVQYEHHPPQPTAEPQNYEHPQHHYPAIDDVYQTFKGRQQPESHPVVEQQYVQEEPHGDQPQQYYYMPVHQDQPVHAPPPEQSYQTMYFYAMEPPDYGHHNVYVVPQGYDDTPLPITENNPRPTHTKVHFTESDNRDHSTQYPLPSIKPFERHAPTAIPIHENYQTEEAQVADYQQHQTDQQYYQHGPTPTEIVTITQRPFNYHAHSLRSKNSKRNSSPTASSPHNRKRINRQKASDSNTTRRTKKQV